MNGDSSSDILASQRGARGKGRGRGSGRGTARGTLSGGVSGRGSRGGRGGIRGGGRGARGARGSDRGGGKGTRIIAAPVDSVVDAADAVLSTTSAAAGSSLTTSKTTSKPTRTTTSSTVGIGGGVAAMDVITNNNVPQCHNYFPSIVPQLRRTVPLPAPQPPRLPPTVSQPTSMDDDGGIPVNESYDDNNNDILVSSGTSHSTIIPTTIQLYILKALSIGVETRVGGGFLPSVPYDGIDSVGTDVLMPGIWLNPSLFKNYDTPTDQPLLLTIFDQLIVVLPSTTITGSHGSCNYLLRLASTDDYLTSYRLSMMTVVNDASLELTLATCCIIPQVDSTRLLKQSNTKLRAHSTHITDAVLLQSPGFVPDGRGSRDFRRYHAHLQDACNIPLTSHKLLQGDTKWDHNFSNSDVADKLTIDGIISCLDNNTPNHIPKLMARDHVLDSIYYHRADGISIWMTEIPDPATVLYTGMVLYPAQQANTLSEKLEYELTQNRRLETHPAVHAFACTTNIADCKYLHLHQILPYSFYHSLSGFTYVKRIGLFLFTNLAVMVRFSIGNQVFDLYWGNIVTSDGTVLSRTPQPSIQTSSFHSTPTHAGTPTQPYTMLNTEPIFGPSSTTTTVPPMMTHAISSPSQLLSLSPSSYPHHDLPSSPLIADGLANLDTFSPYMSATQYMGHASGMEHLELSSTMPNSMSSWPTTPSTTPSTTPAIATSSSLVPLVLSSSSSSISSVRCSLTTSISTRATTPTQAILESESLSVDSTSTTILSASAASSSASSASSSSVSSLSFSQPLQVRTINSSITDSPNVSLPVIESMTILSSISAAARSPTAIKTTLMQQSIQQP